ncbi:malonyl-CoA decarboxylase domain-containing protein [Profundibacter amoris]|uniref:Decarboxylase n=1 Tax=Profundibacter amoris TaxID=2171755 RepID=A0A347UFT1_9RHOB|nr:malonyl-CoA decarboxylase family protein [Profundibacter amoris]AXX97709.1 decarboxylase [Profundibacter amoris]
MLNQFLRSVVEAGHDWLQRDKPQARDIQTLCSDLMQVKGEATIAALAHDIVSAYYALDAAALDAWFDYLLTECDLNPDQVIDAAQAYKESRAPDSLRMLMQAAEAARQNLFRRINQAQGGTAMLVDMRAKLLAHLKARPEWMCIDLDLRHLLSSWFNRGFLSIRRIDWQTSASILEKIMQYESVHKMHGWDDLRRRLADDRRCYAFFHPALPHEPLIFVEVALVHGLAGSVDNILSKAAEITPPDQRDTAIFYSINDCQAGLRGISFGDFLIKKVVSELQSEATGIVAFSTLSPLPGFRKWIAQECAIKDGDNLADAQREVLLRLETCTSFDDLEPYGPFLKALCAHYLLEVQEDGKPVDPVARFHLRNGAELNRINWFGDRSDNGFNQSFGLLVNYVYDVSSIEKNHEDYVHHGRIAVSDSVRKLQTTLAGALPETMPKTPREKAEE